MNLPVFDSSYEPEPFLATATEELLLSMEAKMPSLDMTVDKYAAEQTMFSLYDVARELAQTSIIFDANARATNPIVALAASMAFAA